MPGGKHVLGQSRDRHIFGTVKVGEKGQIVIPKEARTVFGIQPGDTLLVLGDEVRGIVVTRPEVVRVRAQDRDGNFFEVEDSDLTARCFCHEIEHLDGHLFVEHTDHLLTEEELQEYIRRQEEDEA